MTRPRATGLGFGAVLLWALLALFTVGTAPVPPFQLSAMTFALGGLVGVVWLGITGTAGTLRRVPLRVYLFGTLGLFGYHALYFAALRSAPAAEAGLIAYLWPLLIVLFSGLLPDETLRAGHIIGGVLGFAGAAILIAGGGLDFANVETGYLLALAAAVTWASYSVLSRRLGQVPTASVTVFCLATAVLALLAHLMWETTLWPRKSLGWLSVLGLGLGPVGLAFYVWDIGVKRGDIQLLGVAAYAAPVMSTIALVLAGAATPSAALALATVLIVAGAALAARASQVPPSGRSGA